MKAHVSVFCLNLEVTKVCTIYRKLDIEVDYDFVMRKKVSALIEGMHIQYVGHFLYNAMLMNEFRLALIMEIICFNLFGGSSCPDRNISFGSNPVLRQDHLSATFGTPLCPPLKQQIFQHSAPK